MTYEKWLKKIKEGAYALSCVPNEFRTPELCLIAVEQNGNNLAEVPHKLKTPELCLAAIRQDETSLTYVPLKLRTFELCLMAMTEYEEVAGDVPREIRTQIYRKWFLDSIKDKSLEQLLTDDDPYTRELGIYIQGLK